MMLLSLTAPGEGPLPRGGLPPDRGAAMSKTHINKINYAY